jgi:osmotically-inducible protein OsmY
MERFATAKSGLTGINLYTRSINMKLTTGYKRYATIILAIGFASMLGCASTASKHGNKEASADDIITNKVIKAINGEATLKSAQIKVETSKGVVLLTGFVNSAAAENTATELARYIDGVTLVRDGIQIK